MAQYVYRYSSYFFKIHNSIAYQVATPTDYKILAFRHKDVSVSYFISIAIFTCAPHLLLFNLVFNHETNLSSNFLSRIRSISLEFTSYIFSINSPDRNNFANDHPALETGSSNAKVLRSS